MKKIYALAGALALVTGMFAQNKVYHDKVVAKPFNSNTVASNLAKPAIAAAGDTVGWNTDVTDFLPEIFKSGQPYIYGYIGGGYIFGKNVDSLNYCAQGHLNINNTPLVITKALVWVRFKNVEAGNVGNPTSKITVELWDMAANKAVNTNGATPPGAALNSKGPNTKKASVDVMWSDIDTSSAAVILTEAAFSTPQTITGDFAIAVNAQGLKDGDTLCIMADKVGDAANLDYAFHKFARPNSTSVSANWICTDFAFSANGSADLDVSIGMFAVLGNGTAVNEFVNGAKLNAIYPNPTTDMATIAYALENDSKNVNLVIFDSKGAVVKSENFGNQVKGEYKTTFDVSNLAAGSYYYQLISNGYKITKELVVTK
jgi:hypothetical protein